MSSVIDDLQSQKQNNDPPILDAYIQFKAKLNIGDEAFEYLSKADNFIEFSKIIAGGIGGGSVFTLAWLATLGPIAKFALLVGFTSTPIGWIVGASALSAVFAYGLMRARGKSKDATTISIPKYLNTPLDLLGQTVLSLILPATVKMAHSDGHLCENERKMLCDYFSQEWGFNRYFVANAIVEQESLIADFDYEQYRQLLIAATCADKEIKYDVVKNELLIILADVMNADGHISPEEERELEKLSTIINEQGDTKADSVLKSVIASIDRRKQAIVNIFSSKEGTDNNPDSDKYSTNDISEDPLFQRLSQLDNENIRSLLVSGLRITEKNLEGLSKDDMTLMCSKELRSAAGSSCRNLFRADHEFPYKQILIDVADRLADGFTPLSWTKFKLDDSHTERAIEDTILNVFNERARKWWDKLPEKMKAQFVGGIQDALTGEKIKEVDLAGGVKTVITQQIIDNAFQYGVTWGLTNVLAPGLLGHLGVSIVGYLGWMIIVQTLGFMAGIKIAILGIGGFGALGHAITYLGGAAIGGVLSIPSTMLVLDGAAYRKTIPTVIMLLTMCHAKSDSGEAVSAR